MQTRSLILAVIVAASLLSISWASSTYFGPKIFGTANRSNIATCNSTNASGSIVKVRLLIDFGNRTRLWFNHTSVRTTDNIYDLTNSAVQGKLQSKWYGYPLCSHFIQQILGRGCIATGCASYWSLWTWNNSASCWKYSNEGADLITASEIPMVAWYFTNSDSNSFPGHCL